MAGAVADLNPKTLENAKRQFVELYGSALVLNTYLKIALVLVSLVALGLLASELPHRRPVRPGQAAGHPDRRGRPGRGGAVRRHALPAAAAGAALLPDAVHREALQPNPGHASSASIPTRCCSSTRRWRTPRSPRTTRAACIETFLTNPSADEIDVVVQNVSLSELATPPFKAAVSFQKVSTRPGRARARAARRTSPRSISCCATTCRTRSSA